MPGSPLPHERAPADPRTWKLKGSSHPFVVASMEGPSIVAGETVEVVPKSELDRALRERDEAIREANDVGEMLNRVAGERDEARELLMRLRGWDVMQVTGDGPFWVGEIDRALRAAGSEEENR